MDKVVSLSLEIITKHLVKGDKVTLTGCAPGTRVGCCSGSHHAARALAALKYNALGVRVPGPVQTRAGAGAIVACSPDFAAGACSRLLPSFGSFEVRHRKARKGRNPQTGEPMEIAASKVRKRPGAGWRQSS